MNRKVRIGIDVGGTHTKAVAINNETYELLGKTSVKTTHDSKNGVADGVYLCFEKCLHEYNIDPEDVVFIAHSTTQATNALLEGDVAKVGLVVTARDPFEGLCVRFQSRIKTIELSDNKKIEVISVYRSKRDFKDSKIMNETLQSLKDAGCSVVVASSAFGVDDDSAESAISELAQSLGMYASCASSMSKLYGFSRRTKTAIVNASIMPKMIEASVATEGRIRSMDLSVPLMIMRGDGGLMDVNEVKQRPVLTMLSGPAASVMGSLMYLQASNGIYFEVGGTSTNIGVIKNGRPVIDYANVGSMKTFISSLDVEVLGVGGGSMVRCAHHKLIDLGPRSAHIAGFDYACFTSVDKIMNPKLKFFSPKHNDPQDYVAIQCEGQEPITITSTCAANALGLIQEEHFAYGNRESARKAMEPLAEYLKLSIDELAHQILEKAFTKISAVIEMFIHKYQLQSTRMKLVGVGGGAASLLIYIAERMNLEWEIPENAEVISSIGVALAMVQDIVERVIPNPSKEDIALLKQEAIECALRSGATQESISVHIDIDSSTQKITAIASGSTEVRTQDASRNFTSKDLLKQASQDLKNSDNETIIIDETDYHYVYANKACPDNLCIYDYKGFNRIQTTNGTCKKVDVKNYQEVVRSLFESRAKYSADVVLRPEFYLCIGAKVCDFNSDNLDHLLMLMDLELTYHQGDVIVMAVS